MKRFIKKYISKVIDQFTTLLVSRLDLAMRPGIDRILQIQLVQQYQRLIRENSPLPSFNEVEFSFYSQNGEDGILLFIFTVVGITNKCVVDVCAGDGIECNAANLIINHGWKGLLFDGDTRAIERGKVFYNNRTNAWRFRRLPPNLVHAWITAENINSLIEQNGVNGRIDLLSIDMDGIDFWVWKAITCINPRVVVCEYNNRWGPNQSVTIPYQEDFSRLGAHSTGEDYFGVSLKALTKLAQEKGYRLVGCNMPNTNGFFLRKDVGTEFFPEVSVEECLSSEYAVYQHQTKYPLIKGLPVIEI